MKIAIVGATGVIGRHFTRLLAQSGLVRAENVTLLASCRSKGGRVSFGGDVLHVKDLEAFDFSGVDVCFSALSGALSRKWVPHFRAYCALVIDNSSAYRQDPSVPLIVPELNFTSWEAFGFPNLIANPNCTTIGVVMSLAQIAAQFGLERVDIATYQAISGAGHAAVEAFTQGLCNHSEPWNKEAGVCDLTPCIDVLTENGYSKEELKLHHETRKILQDEEVVVSATCVRVPVHTGHSASVSVKTKCPVDLALAKQLIAKSEGVQLMDPVLATPLVHGAGETQVSVSRVRGDLSCPNRMHMWVVSDNLLRGGAYNAFGIFAKWRAMRTVTSQA